MSPISTPSTILRKPSRSRVSKEKKTKAPRASKSLKITSSKSLTAVPKFDVPIVEQAESVFSPLREFAEGPDVESAGPNDENVNRNVSPVVQPDSVVAGATELSQLEQGAVLTLAAGKAADQESSVPAPKNSLIAGKVIRVELPAELCMKPQSAFELMRSARQTGGIVIGEPRPAPKPIEVVGKGKKIATPFFEKVSEATCIVDLILHQVKAIIAEKLEIFESWSLERLSSKYNDTLTNSTITQEWKKRVANEKKVLKWARTSEVAEALKRKDLIEDCMYGKALFPILEAKKENFNPVVKGDEVEMKVLKKLNDILDKEVHVEDVIEEAAQAPLEEDVLITSVVRTEESQEKVAEVTQPETIRSEGEPSKDKNVEEESSSSEEEQDQQATYKKPLLFPNTIVGNVHENINIPLHYSGNLYERFQRAEEELLEEEKDEAPKKVKKNQPEQSLQIHTNFEPIQSMAAESQENSSNEESSTDGNKMLKSMTSVLSSLQKSMIKSLNNQEEERKDFAEIIKVIKELDNTLKKNTYETHVSNINYSKFEKQLLNRQTELLDIERQINDERHKETLEEFSLVKNRMVEIQGCLSRNDNERQEFADSIARKFQAKENAKANAESVQPQVESSRRSDGVSTDTRSRRAPNTDDNLLRLVS
ncbi:ankycorbin-like [Impatiens glandulifera]|uniref:ankycorbin-like n=1 Tax=Impatiens glandulifera TaxID=253017 RepID=UPI001FB10CAB|nr:ankycorbin-like [Impatiens glandulifera]